MPRALKPLRQNSYLRLYDRLFAEAHHDAGGKYSLQILNPDSLKVVTACVESSLAQAQPDQKFLFERLGYFVVNSLNRLLKYPIRERNFAPHGFDFFDFPFAF
ncbi:hypothetical protein B9Z45_16335 [Limnohabitans sp. 2KL-17]|nr:hypothetical protein B9Z45_16335 [Limnohabitans sp. 2KL-17]